MEYILIEDHPAIGVKGLLKDYSGYRNVPYTERCYLIKISPDHDFQFEATWQHEGFTKSEFRFENAQQLNHFLKIDAIDDDIELIYAAITQVNSIAYFNYGTNYYTFKRLR